MKFFKICLFAAFLLILAANNLNGQMLSQKYDSQFTVEIPCTGELVKGTIYFHNISQIGELTGYSKYFSCIHSSDLVSEKGSVYRLAGCIEEKRTDGNNLIYYGVWHFVGKKGNQIRIIITSPPTLIGEFGDLSLSFHVDCDQ